MLGSRSRVILKPRSVRGSRKCINLRAKAKGVGFSSAVSLFDPAPRVRLTNTREDGTDAADTGFVRPSNRSDYGTVAVKSTDSFYFVYAKMKFLNRRSDDDADGRSGTGGKRSGGCGGRKFDCKPTMLGSLECQIYLNVLQLPLCR